MSSPIIQEFGNSGFRNPDLLPAPRAAMRLAVICLLQAATLAIAPSALGQAQDTLLQSIAGPTTGAQSGAQLGFSVSVDGNLTAVGAPYDDIGALNSGVVKVFDSTTGALLHLIPNPSPAEDDLFGISIGLSGTNLIVGASQDDTGAANAGSAYVFDLSSGTPTVPVAILSNPTLNNPSPTAAQDQFGRSVAISGSRVVVGSYQDDTESGSNVGSAYVYDIAGVNPTTPELTLNNPDPADNDWFSWSVAVSGSRVVIGSHQHDTDGKSNAGTAYVYDTSGVTPEVPVFTLTHPAPEANDQYGYSVAISGTRVIVGSNGDDTGSTNAGSAYVYDLTTGTPTVPVTEFNNPSPAGNISFGYAVAISGTRVAVGTPLDQNGEPNNGIACAYELASGTPTVPVAVLTSPIATAGNWYGRSVAVSSTWVIAGAPNDDTGASDAGSAYVYDLSSGTPTVPAATLNNPGPASANLFGYSVSVSGTRMVVGSATDDTGASNAGRVNVYDLASGTPTTPIVTLNNPFPATNDQFGWSVSISGSKVVIGTPNQDAGANDAGCTYLYDLDSPTPSAPALTLNNPDPQPGDNFGWAVAISENRVLVGAHRDDTGATNAGSAYLYNLAGPTPTVPAAVFNNPSPAENDNFGFSLAVSNDRAAIGAYQDDTVASDAGSVYVYDLNSVMPETSAYTLNNPGLMASDWYGYALSIAGNRLIVGTPLKDTGAINNAGSAYLYDITGATPTELFMLSNPSPVAFDNFGRSVAISSARVLIGVPFNDTGASEAGSAYVYDPDGVTPTVPIATLNNPNPAASDQFAISLAISGKTCVIGVPYDDSILPDSGAAFVFGPAAQIVVEQPTGTPLPENSSAVDYGSVFTGTNGENLTFTIRNNGTANLNGIAVVSGGTNASDFIPNTTATTSSLPPGASTTFSVRFQPAAAGLRNASLSISSANGDVNPFVIALSGTGVLPTVNLTSTPGDVAEDGSGNLIYTFSRSGPTDNALALSFSVSGTALFGIDYSQTGADTFGATSGTVTFAAASSTASVTIDPTADTTFEPGETAILTIATGSGYAIGSPDSASGTIANDDTEVSVAVTPSSVTEDGAGNLFYTFTRSGPTDDALALSFSVSGTALFGIDYSQTGADTFGATSGTVTFAAASNTANVTIDPSTDATFEPGESVILSVATGSGYAIGSPDNATGTIINDDTEVSVAVTPSSVTEDGAGNLIYTFTRSGPTDDALAVSFNVLGTASFESDYTQNGADSFSVSSGTVIFAAASSTASVTIDPTADTTFEPGKTAILTIATGSGYAIGSPDSASGTIANDDTEVSVAVTPSSVTEDGAGNLFYTFTRSGPTDDALAVSFNVLGTASFESDYTQNGADSFSVSSGTVIFAAASSTASVTIDPTADTTFEPGESVILSVAIGSGYAIGSPDSASGTIANDDTEVSVAVTPSSVTEDGAGNLFYTFTRSGPTDDALAVSFNVLGTASFESDYTQNGADSFSVSSGTVIFAAASSTASVTIDPTADTTFEPGESVILSVATGSGYAIGSPDNATGTIANDDTEVSVAVTPSSVTEDGAGNLIYTFTRSGPTDDALAVSFNVLGTALFESDYTQNGADNFSVSSGTVIFAAASNTANVTIDPSTDATFEPGESVILSVATGSGYAIGSPDNATGTIINDDTEVSVAVTPSSVTEDGAGNLIYTFTRSGPTDDALAVSFNVLGTASFESDYTQNGADSFSVSSGTVIFAAASSTASVTIDPTADTTFEPGKTAILTIATGSGYAIGSPDSASGTIANDDTEVSVAVTPSSVIEDGEVNLVYTFTRSGPPDNPLTVSFNVGGTALFESDYTQSGADSFSVFSGTVTFATASSTASVTIDPTADTTFEPGETAILTIAAGSGYSIASPDSATGTITNDDTLDQIVLEQPENNPLTSGSSTVNYGSVLTGIPSSRTFTIRNGGTQPITGLTVGVLGSNSDEFIASNPPSSLAGGVSASFTITFTPPTTGERSATLRITSDNIGDTPFEISLTGTGATARDLFNDYAELAGLIGANAEPGATPFSDGVTNLIKYACNLNASGPDVRTLVPSTGTAGLPVMLYLNNPAPTIHYEFLRRKNSGLTYKPLQTTTLTAGSWEPMTGTTTISNIDALWERVIVEQAITPVKRFFRMQVLMDEVVTIPQVSLITAPESVTEDGSGNLVYTFTRTGPTASSLTVSFDVSGTALFGSDYAQTGADSFSISSGTVIFAAASSTATVTIDPTADSNFESDETAILTIATGSGYAIGSPDSATGTITNDDTLDQIVLEQPEGNPLTSGSSTVNYGSVLTGIPSSRTFTIRNGGTQPITGLTVGVLGSNSDEFIASNPPSSLAGGVSASFTITFTPPTTGERSATLRITSDNIGDTPFEISLKGTGATARDLFNDYAELAGLSGANAEPGATPFSDGVTNLIKYACNLNASGPDVRTLVPSTGTAGLPVMLYLNNPAPTIHYEFLRRKNSGLTYKPLQTTTLTAGSWEPMTGTTTISNIDALWERVIIEQAVTPVKQFIRLQVVME
jgi:hypothetical protein